MKRIALIICLLFVCVYSSVAQLEKPISWSYQAIRTSKTEATLYLKATISEKWHIYSLQVKGIPASTKFTFSPSKTYMLVGKTIEPKPITKYDQTLKTDLTYFEHKVVFTQKIKLNASSTTVKGKVTYMACNDKSCLPPDELSFSIPVK